MLAVGDKSTINEKQGDVRHSIVESTVSLEVTPEQAQILSLWADIGKIKLSGRSKDDTKELNTKSTKLNEDLKIDSAPISEPVAKPTKSGIFASNDKRHTLVIMDTKESKDGGIKSSNAEIVEFEEFEKGKWRTVYKNIKNVESGDSKNPPDISTDVPEKVKVKE